MLKYDYSSINDLDINHIIYAMDTNVSDHRVEIIKNIISDIPKLRRMVNIRHNSTKYILKVSIYGMVTLSVGDGKYSKYVVDHCDGETVITRSHSFLTDLLVGDTVGQIEIINS